LAVFRVFAIRFAIGLGIAVVVVVAILAILARVVKRPANLGVREGKLAPCPNSPNCVSTQSQDPRHQIAPIAYKTSLVEAKATLLEVIRAMRGTTVITDEPTYIYVEFYVRGIGYLDDVEFYLDREAQVIHFRSSARLPYYDWQVNRKRMEQVRAAFEVAQGQGDGE
jgi:uncharacterized protein (DUF1499 family)